MSDTSASSAEDDSRTASVGIRVRPAADQRPNNKKQKNGVRAEDAREFVPQGGKFSMVNLGGMDDESSSDSGRSNVSSIKKVPEEEDDDDPAAEDEEEKGSGHHDDYLDPDDTWGRQPSWEEPTWQQSRWVQPSWEQPRQSSWGQSGQSCEQSGQSSWEKSPSGQRSWGQPPQGRSPWGKSSWRQTAWGTTGWGQRSWGRAKEPGDGQKKRQYRFADPVNSNEGNNSSNASVTNEGGKNGDAPNIQVRSPIPNNRERSPMPNNRDRSPSSSGSEDRVSDDSDSDSDSESESESDDEKAGDTIMLNIGAKDASPVSEDEDDYDPESRHMLEEGLLDGGAPLFDGGVRLFDGGGRPLFTDEAFPDQQSARSKEDAFYHFSQKYPTPPVTLADLSNKDLESQAKFIYYDRELNELDPWSSIICIECLQEGHLEQVCPTKEVCLNPTTFVPAHFTNVAKCVHCGAWNKHESNFCPSWRRCQTCRQRGHDEQRCRAHENTSAKEVPCDLCGSSEHLELDCDFTWKFPTRSISPGPVMVSISCCSCLSNRHLVGDCPYRSEPMNSSSWTLNGIDPNMVTNLNTGIPVPFKKKGKRDRELDRLRYRGRPNFRSPSPDTSDDMLEHPDRMTRIGRKQSNLGSIRFGSGIGGNRDLGSPRHDYRDRRDFSSRNSRDSRQRSLSPSPNRSWRGRPRDRRTPSSRGSPARPPRRPPRGRPAPRRGKDSYRPPR